MASPTALLFALVPLCMSSAACTAQSATPTTVVVVGSATPATTPSCREADQLAATLQRVDLTHPSGLVDLPRVLAAWADRVPPNLKGDVLTVSNLLDAMVSILQVHHFDLAATEADPATSADLAALDGISMRASIERLTTWLGDVCAG